jgi:adenine specific DNA methylase Mod
MANHLYYGDNLQVLRNSIATESVDLVYLDPPFNSQANYNVLFKAPSGAKSEAQIEVFEDTWHWNDSAEIAFDEVIKSGSTDVAEMLRTMRSCLRENDMMAYLTMMAVRLLELKRVLKLTGSLYLHCDPTASHYLKILLDAIFGVENFRSEVIWKRSGSHNSATSQYGPIHDCILFYARDLKKLMFNPPRVKADEGWIEREYRFSDDKGRYSLDNLTASGTRQGPSGMPWRGVDPATVGAGRHWRYHPDTLDELDKEGRIHWPKKGQFPKLKQYLDLSKGTAVGDVWTDIQLLGRTASERLGYPTQKPVSLLERILEASSNKGEIVLDPFCGCGTTIHAAQKLGRNWIGIDITHLAISLIEKRLHDAFPGVAFEVHGTPRDIEGARELARRDKYQFQWWAVSLVDAVPYGGKKKGADTGIDGIIYFKPDGKTTEKAIVSVKGGDNVSVAMIRDLGHVVDREKAKIGVFISLAAPTAPMRTEAVKAGFYETPYGKYPTIQILTIEELFSGKKPQMPWVDPTTFKKAQQESRGEQRNLF